MADSVTSKIGKRLVEEGLLAPEELEQAISVQLGIPKVARVLELVDRGLLEGLSLTFLEKHEVLPAFKDSNAVTVILSDPLDDELLRQLERVFGFRDPVGDRDRRGDPRDAPRQATRYITTLEEAVRVVHHNEADDLEPRFPRDVVDPCEGART